MPKRKVCVVTGTRAEYGLLFWLMKDAQADPDVELQIAVTGMHLSPEHGLTVLEIEADGFFVNERVEMLLSSDTAVGLAKSIGLGIIGFVDAFTRLKPDVAVILGDRFEMFAAAQAALVAQIPIAHLHGGEVTEGAFDEAIRHSVTKMASLHFVSAEPYRRRVIQLGEHPRRVFNVGAPGLEHIRRSERLNRNQLEESLGITLGEQNFLITFHPETLSTRNPVEAVNELLKALDAFQSTHMIFTKANADTGGRAINDTIESYVANYPDRMHLFTSLGRQRYISALHLVDVVIGNSSSGVIEAPATGVPTVNIGLRQRGRLRAASVVDCETKSPSILAAIHSALKYKSTASMRNVKLPYGEGDTVSLILQVLKENPLGKELLMKTFNDVPFHNAVVSDGSTTSN